MTKYVFTATHHDGSKITVEFEGDTLYKVLENFEFFLRGTGFYTEGHLDFVTDEVSKVEVDTINLDMSSFNKTYEDYIDLSKCPVCKLTDEQLGPHICYDKNCPKMEKQI